MLYKVVELHPQNLQEISGCKEFGFAILGEIPYTHIYDLLKRKGHLF